MPAAVIVKSMFFEQVAKIWAKYSSVYVSGMVSTLWMSAVTVLVGSVLGIILALMRRSKLKVLTIIADIYVEVIRDTPSLLQLYFFWILLPKYVPGISDTVAVLIGFIMGAGAYISEIIRAGIEAVDVGQWEAGRSIGLSESHVMSKIIMPQAIKNILPALCNEFITTIKGTSLASVFFLGELMTSFRSVQSATFLALQSLTISGIIYFLINITLSKLIKLLERRLKQSD